MSPPSGFLASSSYTPAASLPVQFGTAVDQTLLCSGMQKNALRSMAAARSNHIRRVSLACDGIVGPAAIEADPMTMYIEAPEVACGGAVREAPAKVICPVTVPTVSPNATDDEVDDAASARSRGATAPAVREFFEGPSMFYNDGLNPLLPDRSEEPQRKRRRIKPGPVQVGQPDPHARFVALLWGPRKRL